MGKQTYTYEQLRKLDLRIPHNLPYIPSLNGARSDSEYSDMIDVLLDDVYLDPSYHYIIDGRSIQFLDDRLPEQKLYSFEIKFYVDLNLFMKVYGCNQAQLALYLVSPDYKERTLAETRYREIEGDKKFQEKLKEVINEDNKENNQRS